METGKTLQDYAEMSLEYIITGRFLRKNPDIYAAYAEDEDGVSQVAVNMLKLRIVTELLV